MTRRGQTPVTVVTGVIRATPYLVEWLAWMRVVGVARVIAVSFGHDGHDGHDGDDAPCGDALLDRLAARGVLAHHRAACGPVTPDDAATVALNVAAVAGLVRVGDWVLPCGTDEFPDIAAGQGLSGLVAGIDAGAILLPRRLMGSGRARDYAPQPVTQRFLRGARLRPPETPDGLTCRALHRFGEAEPARMVNGSGGMVADRLPPDTDLHAPVPLPAGALGARQACLRRYAVTSRAEHVLRHGPSALHRFVDLDVNSRPFPPLDPGALRGEMLRLLHDPATQRLHALACADLAARAALRPRCTAAARFVATGDTRPRGAAAGPGRLLCVATHHKTGTVWMRRTLHAIARAQDIPLDQVARLGKLDRLPRDGPRILVSWAGGFPRPLFRDPGARILHVIRDPRDVLISGMQYHLTAPPSRERFLGRRHAACGGRSYQEHLRALPGLIERLDFEMTQKHDATLQEMLAWHFGRANTIELRYEDLMTQTDGRPFRAALEEAAIAGLDIDDAVRRFRDNSLFGGLRDPDERDRIARHIGSGRLARWRREMPRETAEIYAARHGAALRLLGYAEDDGWVAECRPAAVIEAETAAARRAAE